MTIWMFQEVFNRLHAGKQVAVCCSLAKRQDLKVDLLDVKATVAINRWSIASFLIFIFKIG